MEIIFYQNTSKKNVINKIINNELSLECFIKDYNNILNPQIRINYNIDNFNYNFCYIPKLKRYYFIDNITIERNNLINLTLSIDILMTYKEVILNSSGIVKRSKNGYNYDTDNSFTTIEYELENPFTKTTDILVTIQGK